MAVLMDYSGLSVAEVVRRRISVTGLRALTLFSDAGGMSIDGARVSGGAGGEPARTGTRVMEDVLDLLRCGQGIRGKRRCAGACPEPDARLVARVRSRLLPRRRRRRRDAGGGHPLGG